MQITDKGRYGKEISKQLSVLEDMHDNFRQQKDFCFRVMFEKFAMAIGDVYDFINPFKIKLEDRKEYTIKSVSYGADEYAYIICINEEGNECMLEPYCLDAYDDFENVFSEVYDHLKSEFYGIIPTDEFALSTVKYLEQECNWANENKISLETFGKRMRAHTIDFSNDLFDFNLVDDYNMSSKINSDIGLCYCKMLNCLIDFIISYTNEKFCVTLSLLKTKTKLVFTLDKECDVIKDILSGDDNNNRLVNYYLLINKSFIRFKKNKQNFIIEIENNLY